MPDSERAAAPPRKPAGGRDEAERERLASALRENLKRRKAQARLRAKPAAGGGSDGG